MGARKRLILDQLRTSLWFIPLLLAVGTLLLAALSLYLDKHYKETISTEWNSLFIGSVEGMRHLLSTIATSTIGVAGVSFSITLVALSLASNQFGPRLVRGFLRNRSNQLVLGIFLSTFLYCLLILRVLHDGEDPFVPVISTSVALMLALVSLAILIYFINNISQSIHVYSVVASASGDVARSLKQLTHEQRKQAKARNELSSKQFEDFEKQLLNFSVPVRAAHQGYIQSLDVEHLLEKLFEAKAYGKVLTRPGTFVAKGETVLSLTSTEKTKAELKELADKIEKSSILSIGKQRTPVQDLSFAVDELVEIAVRSLSAAINDPFTARTCIHRLVAFFEEHWKDQKEPLNCYFSKEDQHFRLYLSNPYPPKLFLEALETILYYSSSQPLVIEALEKEFKHLQALMDERGQALIQGLVRRIQAKKRALLEEFSP